MQRIRSLIILVVLLFTSDIVVSQIENPYLKFSPEKLKYDSLYSMNFNPGMINHSVLYNCMIDMINLARKEYFFIDSFQHDIRLDSTAQMQADFQAFKNEKTEFNDLQFRTFGARLNKYGLSTNGVELLLKAKAYLGIEEYSYYDLCLELLMPILRNVKSANILLNKRYTYIGFGYAPDQYMKSIYGSIVLGNDLIFNEFKAGMFARDLPYTKGKAGLIDYDEKICAKCVEDASLEELSDYISIKDYSVVFTCNNAKKLRKMIGKPGDAFVIDFVQHLQYDCAANVLDNDRLHRGFVSIPVNYQKLLKDNEITDVKMNKIVAKIADVPTEIDPASDFDINIIVLKEDKRVCRTVIKKHIETKGYDYKEKINLLKDTERVKSVGEWLPVQEESVIEFSIPFPSNKTEFTRGEVESYLSQLNYPKFEVTGIEIVAHNSLNYANDATQLKNQKRRAESIRNTLASIYPNATPATISYNDGWDDFKKDLVHSGDYYDLMLGSKENAIKKLIENNSKIAKELEAEYLVNHRYAKVRIMIQYLVDGDNEQDFVLYKFNHAIENKKLPLAMSIQQYIIKQIEADKYDVSISDSMKIPVKKEYLSFLNNRLYIKRYFSNTLTEELIKEIHNVYNLLTADPIAYFNFCVTKVEMAKFNVIADVNKIQMDIDRLYLMPILPKEKINELNIELQFSVIDFLNSLVSTIEVENLLTSSYNKIRTNSNPKSSSWQNAYKMASYFAKNYEYMYALSLMDPFLDDPNISDDFIFSYISMGAHREDPYLSNLFTKAVTMGVERNPVRLCGLFDRFAISVFDNATVKKIVCKECNR